ncbi:hypothetical protein GOP47_0015714 [Adiantum capillus-veneris]|uniref:Protein DETOXIFICATION n=1 Tax=Adiantum capillus-veneris TaxID=13818 RepID=A0A9D4ZBG9_ADICA|nr:hypothetical protein GOP47_0015714 [Adiantum capillus-veneris]
MHTCKRAKDDIWLKQNKANGMCSPTVLYSWVSSSPAPARERMTEMMMAATQSVWDSQIPTPVTLSQDDRFGEKRSSSSIHKVLAIEIVKVTAVSTIQDMSGLKEYIYTSSSRWDMEAVKEELKKQCRLAGPIILTNLLQSLIQLTSVMFVGHLSTLALSSASIASSIATVTGFSVLAGMGSALETLCGQAYGAGQYRLVGLYMHRGLFVLNAIAIPIAFLWANMERVLLALGQDEAISKKAGEYSLWLIPSLFAYATAQPLLKFLQAQSIVIPLMLSLVSTFCCNIPICWFLIYKLDLGNKGAALATCISSWMNVLQLAIYMVFAPSCEKTRTRFSTKALHDIKGFVKLAVPSALMMCLEWWSYEALVLLSGWLPNPELETSVISICYSTAALAFMIPAGLGAMASIRVANELGAGRPDAARRAVSTAAVVAACEAILVFTTFMSLRNVIGLAYSQEEAVVTYISRLMPVLAASTILDSIQGLLSGILRGCGRQSIGAYINLASYYGVGLPLAFVMAFVLHVKAKGLWMGINGGAVVQLIALVAITYRTNWNKEACEAMARVNSCQAEQEPLLH